LELTAAFLCAALSFSIAGRLRRAGYLSSWLSILQEAMKAILAAVAA